MYDSSSSTALWVDADSCPRQLRSIILKASIRQGIRTVFVADRDLTDVRQAIEAHTFSLRQHLRAGQPDADSVVLKTTRSPMEMVVVHPGDDSADNYIVEHAHPDSLAISRDVPLSARLAEKGLTVLDDRGGVYDASTVRERLSIRNMMGSLRESGIFLERTRTLGAADVQAFANAFDTQLTALLRHNPRFKLVEGLTSP